MRIHIFVEGPSDARALEALFANWKAKLRSTSSSLAIIQLRNKVQFLQSLPRNAARILESSNSAFILTLPDLYPIDNVPSEYTHTDYESLVKLQLKLVSKELEKQLSAKKLPSVMQRLRCSAFKYEMEMLLLAACDDMSDYLKSSPIQTNWRIPVEDQNLDNPPKRILKRIFSEERPRSPYKETIDAAGILSRAGLHLKDVIYTPDGKCTCPRFNDDLAWLARVTGVPVY